MDSPSKVELVQAAENYIESYTLYDISGKELTSTSGPWIIAAHPYLGSPIYVVDNNTPECCASMRIVYDTRPSAIAAHHAEHERGVAIRKRALASQVIGMAMLAISAIVALILYCGWAASAGVNTIGDLINAISSSTLGALILSLAVIVVPVYLMTKKGAKQSVGQPDEVQDSRSAEG